MKILYVTTISNTVNSFLIPHIKMLIDEGHQVDVAFNIEQEVKAEIFEMGCKVYALPLHRSPLKKDNFKAYKMLKNIIFSEGYDLVHTHTPVASAIVRLVCKKLNNVRVFYTAHGFHFYKGAPFINWLVYYPVERWLARYTDTLITINKEDYERAKRKFKAKRVEYIPGVGVDIEKYRNLRINKLLKRKEIGVPEESFLILSVGELNNNKNHEVAIRALAEIQDNTIHYVICGQGPLERYLKSLSTELKLKDNIHFLGYRYDILEICKASDLFVFPSFREGLSVALMESMACDLPVVCSKIRGNNDLVEHGINGFLIDENRPSEYSESFLKIKKDSKLVQVMKNYNRSKINEYDLRNVIVKLRLLYDIEVGGKS